MSALLLWQLADSSLPTGGFAHSNGLEAARQAGEVRNRADLELWLVSSLEQLTGSSLPFVNAAHARPDELPSLDRTCEAFTSNHVANRASRAQGRALLSVVRRALLPHSPNATAIAAPTIPETTGPSPATTPAPAATALPDPPFGHLAPVHGACTAALGLDLETSRRLFAFQHLRSCLAAAVRMNIVGPMEAQGLQARLIPIAESSADRARGFSLNDLAQSAPVLELLQGTQDRLISRLFQS